MIRFTDVHGNEHTATFHSSINTLPIVQYQLVQKFSLIDIGVGSSLHDVNRHLTKFDEFLRAKDIESLLTERHNLQLNFSFILDKAVVPLYITVAMLDTLDGQKVSITSEADVDKYYELFETSTLTYGVIREIEQTQKKSLVEN